MHALSVKFRVIWLIEQVQKRRYSFGFGFRLLSVKILSPFGPVTYNESMFKCLITADKGSAISPWRWYEGFNPSVCHCIQLFFAILWLIRPEVAVIFMFVVCHCYSCTLKVYGCNADLQLFERFKGASLNSVKAVLGYLSWKLFGNTQNQTERRAIVVSVLIS